MSWTYRRSGACAQACIWPGESTKQIRASWDETGVSRLVSQASHHRPQEARTPRRPHRHQFKSGRNSGAITALEMKTTSKDLVTKDRRPVSLERAEALADRLWLERVTEQAAWQGETAPERLTRAFTALEEAGITSRENFTCCRSCGQSEIRAEGRPNARGFVYFHTQYTDSAAAGHGLTLLYGGFDGSSETTAAIGHEVVVALEAVGLHAEWDRDPGRAITVTPPLDWCRRLVG
ncbi:DUF6891 domain-containing protein [Streptomyces canus]|uniref:DUF6891 domain-containing protein n=1 Tax=Streptomyces canus TaxID=58343 RepID=UPI0036CA72B1